ncbi:hypothetical protein ACFQVC_01895 [Streptomyces monticola]|uniref:Lipoprotein n=1 Tax=Streptomyces monticola TaxID=2666263 RepID=A0ABW2JAF4_9ACTN
MSASVRPKRRILAVCAGTALLALSATACGIDDGAAVGVVTYTPKSEAAAEGHGEKSGHGEQEQSGHAAGEEQSGHGEQEQAGHATGEEQSGHAAEEEAAKSAHAEEETEAGATSVTNPPLKGCHKMPGGAHHVENGTLTDLVVYVSDDCTGDADTSKYVGSGLNGDLAPKADSWHSYKFVN